MADDNSLTPLSSNPGLFESGYGGSSLFYENEIASDQNLSFDATRALFKRKNRALDEKTMVSIGMIESGKYTNLAYLLSDQNPKGVKIAFFDDDSKAIIIDRMEICGSVLMQFEKVVAYIGNRSIGSMSVDDGRFYEWPMGFSEIAVKEALLNAIAHRNYSLSGSTLISVMSDRIEISSLGGLVPPLSKDDLLLGAISSRNPRLVALMSGLGMMEGYGTGIPRIMEFYRGMRIQPELWVSPNAFKVILPILQKQASDYGEMILDILSTQDHLRRTDVECTLKVSRARASQMLLSMMDAGAIRKMGSGPSTYYVRAHGKNQ